MKQIKITGPKQWALVDAPEPRAHGEFCVVKVRVAPMCTEFKDYVSGHDNVGHEALGEVVEVASHGSSTKVKVGDRVVVMPLYPCGKCRLCIMGEYIHCPNLVDACRATGNAAGTRTYAQFLLKQEWLLLPIPEDLSDEHGAMACCGLGPTFGTMQRLGVTAFDSLLITGLGPVGLGGVINGIFRRARVIGIESNPYRAALARELGAEVVLDPADPDVVRKIRALTEGEGVSKAVDCSGAPAAQRILLDAVRRKGEVAFVGEGGELAIHVSNDLLRKGLTVHGQWHWNLGNWPQMLCLIRGSRDSLDKLITHRFPMTRAQEAWELQLSGQCGKVLLDPWS